MRVKTYFVAALADRLLARNLHAVPKGQPIALCGARCVYDPQKTPWEKADGPRCSRCRAIIADLSGEEVEACSP